MRRFVFAVASLAVPFSVYGKANETGLNVNYLYDSDNVPLLADLMRTYRTANLSSSAYNANDATLDANGWATSDAWYFLGDPAAIKRGDGTYALKFNGSATVSMGLNNSGGQVLNQTYDPVTNTTTALLQTRPNVDLTDLRFSNTQRDAASATNTGVTNIQVMRPTTMGGNTPYAFGTTFTDQSKAMYGKVGTLRFMDYLATNNNIQQNWTDRVKPTDVKLNPTMVRSSRGKGGPLELAVQLGNETGRDIWINIPALASDDYVTKVAQLIRYGSDGTNPYTSPQANPVFKPLASGLKVYLEYSNETWNTDFLQNDQLRAIAKAQLASEVATPGTGPMEFANGTNLDEYRLAQRYGAVRTKQIADLFGGVYGTSELTQTVRPILSWQYGNGTDSANQATLVLDGYYNNSKGNFVTSPTAISTYIYGGGSAMYYSPSSGNSTLTVDKIVTEPAVQTAAKTAKIVKDLAFTTTFGIKRVAYEGGLSLDPGGSTETADLVAIKQAALADARLTQLTVTNHNTWTNQGGDLLVYYFASDQYKFGFTDENFSTTTPKLNGLEQLANSSATQDYAVGVPLSRNVSTVIKGGKFDIKDNGDNAFDGAVALTGGAWTSYLINIPTAGDYTVLANYKTYGAAARLQLQLGGATIAEYGNLLSNSGYSNTPGVLLTLPAGITSIRVLMNYASADISLASIMFNPIPSANPIPEPATGGVLLAAAALGLRRRRRA